MANFGVPIKQSIGIMKNLFLFFAALFVLPLGGQAQQLPQFAFNDFEGWSYNGVELTSTNIGNGNITLYVTSMNVALTLTSPEFSCQDIDTIHADVYWKSLSINIPLTMAIDDADGTPLDSVSCYPTQAVTAPQVLPMTLPVPAGLATARLRFVSWEANVNNGGAVRKIVLTGTVTAVPTTVTGDVDGDGHATIADVTALINYLLSPYEINADSADVNKDGKISIDDVTALINMLLSGN